VVLAQIIILEDHPVYPIPAFVPSMRLFAPERRLFPTMYQRAVLFHCDPVSTESALPHTAKLFIHETRLERALLPNALL
jgi:hypothetical protein